MCAFYIRGGVENANSFLNQVGLRLNYYRPGAIDDLLQSLKSNRQLQIAKENSFSNYNIICDEFERILNYKFKNRNLLCLVIRYGIDECHFQRLEFLGDAVMDFVIARFFFNR